MIAANWQRVAGVQVHQKGEVYAVWLARDPDTDVVHCYDACKFTGAESSLMPVIVEGLAARGRRIPIAWTNKAFAERLLESGCNTLPDPTDTSEDMIEVLTNELRTRMVSGRLRFSVRLIEVREHLEGQRRKGAKIPKDQRPYNDALRTAIAQLRWARAEQQYRPKSKRHREVPIF